MKKKRVITAVVAFAALAVFALYYALVAPAVVGKDRVVRAFGEGVGDALALQLSYKSAAFKLLPRPAVALRGAVLTTAAGKDIVRADELKLGLSYWGFITLRPAVATVELKRPRGDLAAGDVRFGAGGQAPPFRGTVVVVDGFMRYVGAARTAFVDGLDGKVRCRAEWGKGFELRGKLAADKLSFAEGAGEAGGGMAIAAEGKVRYQAEDPGGRVFLDKLDLLFGKARLSAEGQLQTGPGEKDVDLAFTGRRMALAQVLPALLPRLGEAEIEGELDLKLTVKGKWGEGKKPDVRGELTVAKGAIRPDNGDGLSNVAAKVRFVGEEYLIEKLEGQSKQGGFKARGKILPVANWPFELTVEGVVPLEAAALLLGMPEGYMLAGPADLNLDVAGELSRGQRTTLDGTIQLRGCRCRVKPFAEPFRALTGTVNCQGYKLSTGKVKGEFAGGTFEIGGSWQGFETPRLEFVVVATDLDLDAALPSKDFVRHEGEGGTKLVGLPGKSISARANVKMKSCKLLRIRAQNLAAEAEFDAGVLNLKQLQFDAYDGKVQAQATVYPGARPRYTFAATVRDVRLGVFLTENKWLENVLTGKFAADVVFSAEGTTRADVTKTFGGKGSLELSGGRVADMPLLAELAKWSRIDLYEPLQVTKLWATADANAGVIKTRDFKLENPDLVVEAAGEVDLEKKLNFVVRTTFQKKAAERLAREGKALALVRDDDGKGHFNFVVTGEAGKPAFQLESTSMLGGGALPGTASRPTAGTAEVGGDIF